MSNSKMGYAIELLNGGSLHCGFWHYPIHKETPPDKERSVPWSQPLNAKQTPPLVFATESAAETALEFYYTRWGDSHIEAGVKAVNAEPTHRLTDGGFAAVEMGEGTLFA